MQADVQTTAVETITMEDIDARAREYSAARGVLLARLAAFDVEEKAILALLEGLQKEHGNGIRLALKSSQERRSDLKRTLAIAPPAFFKSPRTVLKHAVEVGLRNSQGTVDIPDENRTIELIEDRLKALSQLLIHVEKTPIKSAIKNLSKSDHELIGVSIVGKGDQPVISPSDKVEAEETAEKLLNSFAAVKKS